MKIMHDFTYQFVSLCWLLHYYVQYVSLNYLAEYSSVPNAFKLFVNYVWNKSVYKTASVIELEQEIYSYFFTF